MEFSQLKVLFVTPHLNSKSGGGILTESFVEALKSCFDVDICEIFPPTSLIQKVSNLCKGQIMNIDKNKKKIILQQIHDNTFDFVIFNHAYFGPMANTIRKVNKKIKIYTIGHNVEYNFSYGNFKTKKNISSLFGWMLTYYAEYLSIKNSDFLIALNKRDSENFFKIYNKNADLILPIGLKDIVKEKKKVENKEKYGLFVGSAFYANIEGIKWFKEKVSPCINVPIKIIGRGFENFKDSLNDKNIRVIGSVDDIESYYQKASFVISPIFLGSGMKTKTAEAMMFGKYIIASDEALEGYEYTDKFVKNCNSAEEFISAINNFDKDKYIQAARDMYIKKYSQKALREKLIDFILFSQSKN